ncbi:Putative membrane protein OS=Streptomyces glaucescens OX=1907 GN=SGLAU_13040 PE=4 SV=1 [Streptomyces glaucescens]
MADIPSSLLAASGLVGGYGVARWTGKRPLGGAVLAVAGAAAARQWRQRAARAAPAPDGAYAAAFAGSRPLAKKVGAWPAVLGVAGAVALASWAVADRRTR